MEQVHVVIAVGCTPVVHVFSNEAAAEVCKSILEEDFDKVYTYYRQDVLEDFAKYCCSSCGSTTFVMTWTEKLGITLEYDPSRDRFSTVSCKNAGDDDADDIEIACDSCGTGIDGDLGGDLGDRMFDYV